MKILPKKKLKVLALATNCCTLKNNPNKTQYPQYIFFKSYVNVVFQRTPVLVDKVFKWGNRKAGYRSAS